MTKTFLTIITTICIILISRTSAWAVKNPFTPQLPEPVIKTTINTNPNPTISQRPSPRPTPRTTNNSKPPTPIQAPEIIFPSLTVKGIIWKSTRPQAIINEKIVDEGDIVEGVKILKINKDNMDVIYNGINKTISY